MTTPPQGLPSPQQPYPPVPPPGHPGMPRPTPRTNGLAITSLVTGILCLVPPLGLILGGVALGQIRRRGEQGKGLAVAGMVLSAVSTLLVALGFAAGGFQKAWDGLREVKDEVASSSSAFSLTKGDCFDEPGGSRQEKEVMRVKSVNCDDPHDAEVTGSFKLTGDTYPGVPAIEKQAEERCYELGEAYAMDTWSLPENAGAFYLHPTEQSWRTMKDRTVTCAFVADTGKLTGSLRRDATTLTPAQVTFLKAVNSIDIVTNEEPEADPETDLSANLAWAGRIEKALGGAVTTLRGHSFPEASAKPVADLAKELETARRHWVKAAKAADADTFWEHYEAGWDSLPPDLGKDARGALNLGTTPPAPSGGE